MKKYILQFLQYIKYRKIVFKKVGKDCTFKALSSIFEESQNISLGNNVWIGKGAHLDGIGNIDIGNGVIMAPDVVIYTRNHNFDNEDLKALPFDNIMLTAPVIIEDYVWIGRKVIVLSGVTIGKGAVIGAGAVVAKDIPPYAVAVGNPAKVVKYRDKDKFNKLYNKVEPFVYKKFGNTKIFKKKSI